MTDPRYTLRLAPVAFHVDSARSVIAKLAPDAARSLDGLAHLLVAGSCFRPPSVSRSAYLADQRKPADKRKGVARPGDSAHGWGLALDVDLARTFRVLSAVGDWSAKKRLLDMLMAERGWLCYEAPGARGREAHHWAFIGGQREPRAFRQRETLALIDEVVAFHAKSVTSLPGLLSERLTKLAQALLPHAGGYDPGPADGIAGPRTRQAVAAFRREWALPAGGVDARLLRCLCAVTARVETPEEENT